MIKVISTVPHQSVVKQIVCKHCGSTLEYAPVDVLEYKWTDYGGDVNLTKYIVCPTCSDNTVISTLG
jgi:DNA-directed RNA polymerase subunit RPC12/RpoP